MAFTEFYCNASTGSNLNAGSETGGAARLTYASGTWVNATGVFTVASGNPTVDGVVVGDFASVYPDASTLAVFIGRVTAKSTTTITVSLTAKSGTDPADGTTNTTLKIGGTWKGPNAAIGFPFNFVAQTMNDGTNLVPRVNLKNNATYNITAATTHTVAGPISFQGYTTTAGDLGRSTIDGGTSGASYALLTISGVNVSLLDIIFQNNGATGNANGVSLATTIVSRCVVAHIRCKGVVGTGIVTETECFDWNQSNSSFTAAFDATGTASYFKRCIAHDAAGSNCFGFNVAFGAFDGCIADTCGSSGFANLSAGAYVRMLNCDAYNNVGAGLDISVSNLAGIYYIENCNFVKNGSYGIKANGSGLTSGQVFNCGFGSGTQANTSGTTVYASSGIVETGSINYASGVLPWVDAPNGDFRVNLAAAKGAGRGAFTQTASSYAGTVGYPDIGAAQHQDAGGGIIIIED